ncbi:hypothetical protein BDF14DRAFT_1736834 [Spinellus fusiger]|nr:hypothetical protein BDF14DRAFT_1736834 [Spinellus fusiger]
MNLSPKQHHYFKRHLVTLQLEQEINALRLQPDVSLVLSKDKKTNFPFLRLAFQHLVLTFPLLKEESEIWEKFQLFLDSFCKIDLDTFTPKQSYAVQRKMMAQKAQKVVIIALCACIKTGAEESIKVNLDTKMSSLPRSLPTSSVSIAFSSFSSSSSSVPVVEIVTVRKVQSKYAFKETSHAEYILQTEYKGKQYYVARRHRHFRQWRHHLKTAYPSSQLPHSPPNLHDHTNLYREKDRRSLRYFVRTLCKDPEVVQSKVFLDFLMTDTCALTAADTTDMEKRAILDDYRKEQQEKIKTQVDSKVAEIETLLEMLKEQVKQPGGLVALFEEIKATPLLEDLPEALRKAAEWGRISFAFVLHKQFLLSDRAPENLANLKRTHGMMPYRTMALMLKVSSPMTVLKGMMDLFLARPFGTKSLFQRMLLSNLQEESKGIQRDIDDLEKTLDPRLCEKLFYAVRTSLYGCSEAEIKSSGHLLAVLQNPTIAPLLTEKETTPVFRDIPLQKRLRQLWTLYSLHYEQEMMRDLVFEGATGELIKELFAIFYQPLAQVYRAADIGSTLRHVAAFIDDLILLLESEDATATTEKSLTIQMLIQLVEKHEQNFYGFVHNVYTQDTSRLFDELLHYVDGLFIFMSQGLEGTLDLEQVVDKVDLSEKDTLQLREEIDSLCVYRHWQKTQHLEKMRYKMMTADKDPSTATTALDSFDIFGENAQLKDEFLEMEYESEETCTSEEMSSASQSSTKSDGMEFPDLVVIPRIVPYFVEGVSRCFLTS